MTTLAPNNLAELSTSIAEHHARGAKLPPVNLRALRRIIAHTPEDMTVKVEAGLTLAELQSRLATAGQWLPVDPPFAERVTIRELLEENLSGPRRCGHGTVREHLIGLGALLADGRLIHSGGNVVKNVAGYDLQKLFIGSRGTLGIVVEATFKVQPLPEAEEFIAACCDSLEQAAALIGKVQESPLTPVAFDLHNGLPLPGNSSGAHPSPALRASSPLGGERDGVRGGHSGSHDQFTSASSSPLSHHRLDLTVILAFAGPREDVEWQLAQARSLGFTEPSSLAHDERFWSQPSDVCQWSVLPARLGETLAKLGDAPFMARVANGVIFARGGLEPPKPELPVALLRRVKDTFDPKHILPEPDL
ncbi:MAG: FAD-binding oxidoreductase [Verrucomicrobia bacterium]|nr:FAD-binding oxidoreductase [Verrucomicrobiota bacterium]